MKQPGLSLISGIVLMSIILYAEAQSTTEPTVTPVPEDCLDFPQLASNSITLSWNSSCFNGDPSYKIQLTGSETCTKDNYPCQSDTCYIALNEMECGGSPIRPCESATYTVSGKPSNYQATKTTTVAPLFTSADWQWQLQVTDNSLLNATWGPPTYSDTFAKCATKARVIATCPDANGNNKTITDDVDIPDPSVKAIADELDISDCEGDITFTVIYMIEESLTETTSSTTLNYEPGSTTTYETDSPDITPSGGPNDGGDGLSGGEIAGIVIGSVAGVAVIGGGTVVVLKKKKIIK